MKTSIVASLLGGYVTGFLMLTVIYIIVVIDGTSTVCENPMRRIEYVFPARAIGCWLGEVP